MSEIPLKGEPAGVTGGIGRAELAPLEEPPVLVARPRVGVVLAAGRSERLSRITGGGSKALVRLGGLSLVERAVRTLLNAGLQQVLVVVGHHAGPVVAVVNRLAPGKVRAVYADDWEAGNGASLAAAATLVSEEQFFVVVTADHVFAEGALDALVRAGEPAVLIDQAPERDAWDEGTRVRLSGGRAVAFDKGLQEQAIDCGAFVFPAGIFEAQRRAAAAGDPSLSGAVTRFAADHPLAVVLLPAGSWWQDVDTPEDLGLARIRLRRSLIKEADGPVSRYLNRPISSSISMAVAPLRLSPDLVSVIAFLFGVVAAGLLATGYGIAGGVLVHLASVLDGCDGEVARLQLRASPRGALLDGVLDRAADAAILAGLGLWANGDTSQPGLALGLAVAATFGAMLSMASKDRIALLGLTPAPERALGWLLGGRDGRLLLITIGALFGRPMLTLGVVAATSMLSLLLRVYLVRRLVRTPASRGRPV